MKYLRSLIFSSFTFLLLISTAHSEVLAFTAKQEVSQINTCRELQDAANRMKWSNPTTFQGFENLQVNTKPYKYGPGDNDYHGSGSDRLCQLGYVTVISPMGKRICKGYLYTDVERKPSKIIWGSAYMSTSINSPRYRKSDFCRYIQ
jgi:hypothetical protein